MANRTKNLFIAVCVLLAATVAGADTKVVQNSHTDAVTIMNRSQPATDTQTTTWFGEGRMAAISENTCIVVRADQKKMYIIDHDTKSYSVLDLPLDFTSLLPPGMGAQMMQMMAIKATVQPTDEHRQIGEWKARRWNVTLTSQMMNTTNTVWATTDVDLDMEAAWNLSREVMKLQPGMQSAVDEMAKIEGFQVAMESVTQAMGNEVKSRTETVSITSETPPAGTYEPPAGYTVEEFDLASRMGQ